MIKGKIVPVILLLAALMGIARDAKCDVTLILPQGSTIVSASSGSGVGSVPLHYTINGNQTVVSPKIALFPTFNRIVIKFTIYDEKSNSPVTIAWNSKDALDRDVVQGETITIVTSAWKTAMLTSLNAKLTDITTEFAKYPWLKNRKMKDLDDIKKQIAALNNLQPTS